MKLLNREYTPSKTSSGYLSFNNPALMARYVFKADEVIDEVTGLRIQRLESGGFRLPVPDINAGCSVRVAYKTLGNLGTGTKEEILRIGSAGGKAMVANYILTLGTTANGTIKPTIYETFDLISLQGLPLVAYGQQDRIPIGLQILEFNVRGSLATKDAAGEAIAASVQTAGEFQKEATRTVTFPATKPLNLQADHYLTTEFNSSSSQVLFVEVYAPEPQLEAPRPTLHNNHSNKYFGLMCADPSVLKNLQCNVGVFGGTVQDSLDSTIATFGNDVRDGFIDLSSSPVVLASAENTSEWTCRFVAVPDSVTVDAPAFTLSRGGATLDVMLDPQHLLGTADSNTQLIRNGKHLIAITGMHETVLVHVDGVLKVTLRLPIGYPLEPIKVELKSGLGKVNGVQLYDCSLLNSTQFFNKAVSGIQPSFTVHSAFENENASIDFAQGRDTGLTSRPFNLTYIPTLTPFRIPNVPRGAVVGISSLISLEFPLTVQSVTYKLFANVNGTPLEFTLAPPNNNIGVYTILKYGTEQLTRWLKRPSGVAIGARYGKTYLHVQVCDGNLTVTLLGRSFVLSIPKQVTYDITDITFGTVAFTSWLDVPAITVHRFITYTGDADCARRIPSFVDYSTQPPRYSAEAYPSLAVAFGIDKVELVSNTPLPVTPYLTSQETSRGLLIGATNIGNITCAIPNLSKFTLALSFIPTGAQWVRLQMGTFAVTLNSSNIRVELGTVDVTGPYTTYTGPRELVVTYTGTEVFATVNGLEILREPYSEVIAGTTNLGIDSSGSGSFALVDFRLYSDVVAVVPGKELVLRARPEGVSPELNVTVTATAITTSAPEGLGSEATLSPLVPLALIKQAPVEMLGCEINLGTITAYTLVKTGV